MSKSLLVVVNGHPRSGKDTAIDLMRDDCHAKNAWAKKVSSIDPVFAMLRAAGITMVRDNLSDKDRDLMAEVGASVEKHSNFRTRKVFDNMMTHQTHCRRSGMDAVMFVLMREPENIRRLAGWAKEAGIGFTTLYVERPGVRQIFSNVADSSVEDMEYTHRLVNAGSIDDLKVSAKACLVELMEAAQ